MTGSSGSGSAGYSPEIFVPSTGQHCQLAGLPAGRSFHSMESSLLCGGFGGKTSCLTLTEEGTWEETASLLTST